MLKNASNVGEDGKADNTFQFVTVIISNSAGLKYWC